MIFFSAQVHYMAKYFLFMVYNLNFIRFKSWFYFLWTRLIWKYWFIDFVNKFRLFIKKKLKIRRSVSCHNFMTVQMINSVRALFERSYHDRDFSFWITDGIDVNFNFWPREQIPSGSCHTNFWLLHRCHVKYWSILMFLL
jgi:hypothetical protein